MPIRCLIAVGCLFGTLVLPRFALSGDWPTWRYDAARSASSPDDLPRQLHLQWVRELPSPRPAWPASQQKLQFDAGYEPVVADGRMFVGSNVNDSVTAYDTDTGDVLWRCYTDGPVRFAPTAFRNRVYAVSDDGCLYCLDAATGGLIWKVRGGPKHRPIIGNERLVSTWPARGGVVLDDGVACFAAGIWPSMGVFVHAVDASSGEVLWTNSETSSLYVTHPHGADSFGSISPQGYLAVSGENLLVPGGRTLPGVFDLRTGELRSFNFGGKGSGGYDVIAADNAFLVQNELYRLQDATPAADVPAALVNSERTAVGTSGSAIVLTTLDGRFEERTVVDRRGREQLLITFEPDAVRRFDPETAGRPFLQAGGQLVVGTEGRVATYDLDEALRAAGGPAPPEWSAAIDGVPWTMLAADDKLIVVTNEARIYCFGESADDPVIHELERAEGVPADNPPPASPLRDLSEISPGYAVMLGIASPDLLQSLLQQSELYVIGIDPDAVEVDALRRDLDAAGHYGRRATVHVGDPLGYNLPPYLASLVVCERPHVSSADELHTVFAMLRPYGGTACLKLDEAQHAQFVELLHEAQLSQAEIEREQDWTILRRRGALPGAGVWTHQYGDASNSVVSRDTLVQAPLGVLWFGGPSNDRVLPRHGHGPSPQVAGGRLFIEGADMLRCVDVYNGHVWWERELPGLGTYYDNTSHHPGAGEIGSNYVSLEDHVYVVYGRNILELNASTGETTREISLTRQNNQPDPHWGAILVDDDFLIATASPVAVEGMQAQVAATVPPGYEAIVEPHSEWSYLAGSDPPEDWTSPDFHPGGWKTGEAGFGYGDNDDRTVLSDMPGRYQRVYVRAEFDGRAAASADSLTLTINYDDAFIAYLNGREVLRMGVGRGAGAAAADLDGHEADGYESFEITVPDGLLKPGKNVLALEGHNDGAGSSDFSLDPYLLVKQADAASEPPATLASLLEQSQYASSSRTLHVFNRHTGERLWSREAAFSFRHNAICAGDGKVFCIDGMSPAQLDQLRRRGVEPPASPQLLALDAGTGDLVWSTDESVFGTFLNYSTDYGVLLQAGSAYRDRAEDEVDRGLVAYRGDDGDVLWSNSDMQYGGPCLLWRDRIITNGGGGFALELLTGQPTGWEYERMYGCNTALGSEHLLTFRSGAAGFFDLAGNSGTANLGGFRSSCTSNLVAADGVLNAPDFTRTCVCAYQLQTSLAFVHDPDVELWAFNVPEALEQQADQSIALNLGAPGDRSDDEGTLWLEFPIVGGPSPAIDVSVEPENVEWFTRHSSMLPEGNLRWVGASGARGIRSLTWNLGDTVTSRTGTVRLVFAEPDQAAPGQRIFHVALQGREVLRDFDVSRQAAESDTSVVMDFPGVQLAEALEITLTPAREATLSQPVLCGVAVIPDP